MKVIELIEVLKKQNPHAIVLVDAYEDQYTKIDSVDVLNVLHIANEKEPNFVGDYSENKSDAKGIEAVYLSRFVNGKT